MQNKINISSYILMAGVILFMFFFHLMPSVIGAMAVFLIVNQLHNWLGTKVHSKIAHTATVLFLTVSTVGILTLIGLGIYSALQGGEGGFHKLSDDALNIVQQLRNYLPAWLVQYIPEDIIELKEHALAFVKGHLPSMLAATGTSAKTFVHVIIGMFIGAVIAFSFLKKEGQEDVQHGPLTEALVQRIALFTKVFKQVVFAQLKISSINAILTGIYLLIALPIFGIHIPYAKTLVLLTLLFGLIPVIGNLLSNTLIVVLSLMISFEVAVASLVFLVVIHKLEYYINAKIVGAQIKTSIWELLIMMLVMESVFGVIGVVLAPVIYGYIKEELKAQMLI